ncbi:chemotaxis protein CheW [Halopseudomonas phragmitis]|uniref:Chemotaxis protein CheW n=2 Tax=Pseudomonadaceae TaxID=135621 RepID=A0A1V0B8C4_9GAMM|nr:MULTISPECIES: chemotaxis protein CheW [Pseudomonadaceae]AQZ96198.1 chemotaxis protein CheW [Halopseudomonas phragmitis]PAU89144.1 chemotaxis protein CheW [Pseudomonas sp. WN033]RHW20361.1 chemotaxis protein CheW [Pseudomonas jilinensis]
MKNTAAQGAEDPILQWVTFRLDNETYGINVMQVQEVLRHTEIAPVPGAPAYVLGIINLRGNVVTVIDTRQRFGLGSAPITDNTRIVIIEADKQVVGILVDSVAEVVYLRQSEIETAPNVGTDESAKFIQGVCNKNNELLILVDLEKMMTEDEWAELQGF